MQRGLTLAEAVISIAIVGVMLVAGLNTVASARLGALKTGDRGKGMLLAQQLMTEILQQNYEEPVDTVDFGRESSESGGDRADYDDVDDYAGWSSEPPENKDGSSMADLENWSRKVTVTRAQPTDLRAASLAETGIKGITVTVEHNGVEVASLASIRTRAGLEPP